MKTKITLAVAATALGLLAPAMALAIGRVPSEGIVAPTDSLRHAIAGQCSTKMICTKNHLGQCHGWALKKICQPNLGAKARGAAAPKIKQQTAPPKIITPRYRK